MKTPSTTTTTTATTTTTRARFAGRFLLGAAAIAVPFGALAMKADAGPHEVPCNGGCVIALADTDGDGYSDAIELALGSNPADASSVPALPGSGPELNEDLFVTVSFDQGPGFVTTVLGLPEDIRLNVLPNGVKDIASTLIDPRTGQAFAFTPNHHGIDVRGAGIDLGDLSNGLGGPLAPQAGPGSDQSASQTGPAPELRDPFNRSLYADDGDGKGTTKTTLRDYDKDKDDKGSLSGQAKDLVDKAGKLIDSAGCLVKLGQCNDPGTKGGKGDKYTDPDAVSPDPAAPTAPPSNPNDPYVHTAPDTDDLQAPSVAPANPHHDPNIELRDPDAVPGGGTPTALPKVPGGGNTDPVNPDDGINPEVGPRPRNGDPSTQN